MKKPSLYRSALGAAALVGAISSTASAGDTATYSAKGGTPPPVAAAPDLCESLWDIPHLYSNPDGFWLTDLKLIGRYQVQYGNVDSSQGGYDDWESRRWRAGAEAKILGGDWKVKGEINIDDSFNPFYKSLEEAYIQYKPSDSFALTIGKQKPKWSYEWGTSSRKILTFERSLLVNQLHPDKSSGVSVSGKLDGGWSYELGIYSGDLDREFGGFDAGIFANSRIGYDYSDSSGLDHAGFNFDWLYNGDSENNATADYRHSWSLNHSMKQGAFGLHTDLIYADGFEADAYGLIVLPTYDISDKLQFVGRYTYAHGDSDSLRAQSRYERRVPHITDGGHGEEYHSFYAGLNYYICDHKLKLMGGVEYSDLTDSAGDGGSFDGWTAFTGLRFYY